MWSCLTDCVAAFRVEALDTRLRPPKDPTKRQAIINRACPFPRWQSPEHIFYLGGTLVMILFMIRAAMSISNETSPNYDKFKHLLSKGWLFGRNVDNSDTQYSFFRDNFFLLAGVIIIHLAARRTVSWAFNFDKRLAFDFVYGMIFLFAVHGFNAFKVLVHVLVMFGIAKLTPSSRGALALTWVYGVLTLFINHAFSKVPTGIDLIDNGYEGLVPRWDVFYNFTLLRMISFNCDFLERRQNTRVDNKEDDERGLVNLAEGERLTAPLPISDYSILNYIAYITYTPLFIAGPIITFNDYIYQLAYEPSLAVKDRTRIAKYFGRLVFCILVMEFILHYMYVVACVKARAWDGGSPFQLSMLGMFNLIIVWLKLLIPWRVFRFWSLMDGIDPPENMLRCMNNNYSALAFWRAWHRSFNRWVIRYIYVPMGGGGRLRVLNNVLVFLFVAIWHDIELKLLVWGWLAAVILVPELAATLAFAKYSDCWWFRHACAAGAVVNIWLMLVANLFGFCLGKDGTIALLKAIFLTASGYWFLALSFGALYVGVSVMFEIRQDEMRRGIDIRC